MTKTLLAVDDSKTMRKVLGITFAASDYEPVLVESAQRALEQLETVRPDMVLADVTLSDMDGYELCRQVKSRAPSVPVMILSSRQQPYDAARGADVQADDFIDKPFDTQALRDKVSKLIAAAPKGVPAPSPVAGPPPRAASVPPPAPSAAARAVRPAAPMRPAPAVAPRAPAVAPAAVAPAARPAAAPAASVASNGVGAALKDKLKGLDLSPSQVEAVLALSREVIEQVVWEVVPVLAETLIKEEITRLTSE